MQLVCAAFAAATAWLGGVRLQTASPNTSAIAGGKSPSAIEIFGRPMWLKLRSLPVALASVVRDSGGAAATIVTIALPCLLGIGALGAETGVWFTIKLQNQSAADSAAIAAAYGVIAGKTDLGGGLTAAADEAARRNGYKGSTPAVVYPYSDSVVSNGIAVTLKQSQGALLAAMFLSSVTVSNTAVAVIEVLDRPCILALGTSGTDVQIGGSVQLQMPACSVVANSIGSAAVDLANSSSSLIAATLVTAGEVSVNGTRVYPAAPQFALSLPATIGGPTVADPYASTLTHAFLATGMPTAGRCKSNMTGGVRVYQGNCVISGSSLTQPKIKLTGGTQIAGGWTIQTGQTVDLSPGTYWITGDLGLQSAAVLKCSVCSNGQGIGVTIIFIAQASKVGALSVDSNAIVNLNAPNSGLFSGLVIVQDSNNLPQGTTYTSLYSTIDGNAGGSLNGLIYFPNSSMTFHGAPSSVGPKCLLLIGSAVKVDATSSLDATGCTAAGLVNLPKISKVGLAE